MRFATFASVVAVVFAGVLTFDTASAAPIALPDMPLDLDLKQADIKNLYALLADATGRKIELDPCVHGEVDLRLQNVPVSVVLDALAAKMKLVYDDDGTAIHVLCKDTPSTPVARVSLTETGAALNDVLTRLAGAAKLDGVDYRATTKPTVDMNLRGVRLATALSALEDSTGVKLRVVKNRLVVTDP